MDASFEQLYQQLSEEHGPHLEEMRSSITRRLWIVGLPCAVVAVLVLWLLPPWGGITLFIAAILIITLFLHMWALKQPYVLYFRKNVAKNFVAQVDPKLSYSPEPQGNLRRSILKKYHVAKFDGRTLFGDVRKMIPVGTPGSPGLSNFITGKIEGRPFQLCCMALGGADNDSSKFKGLFVNMKVNKSLNGFIKVQRKIWGSLFGMGTFFIPGAELQRMDSVAFEKDFFVGSNDQIMAMQYLTADVMELLLNFKNELVDIQTRFNRDIFPQNPNSISLDFFWQGNEVLMRIGNKKMFRPTLRNPMCKDSLACCLSSLRFVTKLNHAITKSIKETAI